MLEYAEAHGWDSLTVDDVVEFGTETFVTTYSFISDMIKKVTGEADKAKGEAEKKAQGPKTAAPKAIREAPKVVEKTPQVPAKTEVSKIPPPSQPVATAETSVSTSEKISGELEELVARAEAAIAGRPYPGDAKASSAEVLSPESSPSDTQVYNAPLPLGFEPPPGFSRPQPPRKAAPVSTEKVEETKGEIEPVVLPLVAPAVSSLTESEPIIAQLAGTIDNLASYLASNPAAASRATDVLETAKKDLTSLADRFENVREGERVALEAKLDEQTREYSLKLLELEMEAQDKLESQQEDFKKVFDEERAKIIQAYRQKLENELRTQTELINERYVGS
jgi:mitofilin